MKRTVEEIVDEQGVGSLLVKIELPAVRRALVTILEEVPHIVNDTMFLSEGALAEDWNRPEVDAAWLHLQ